MTLRDLARSLLWQIVLVLVLGLGLYELAAPLGRPGAGAVAVVAMGALMYGLVVRRIRRLNRMLRGVAGGDLQVRLRSRSGDEIGRLTDSIDDLVRTLRENYEELRTHDELRRRLVANVSHELRTPLTEGYLETVLGQEGNGRAASGPATGVPPGEPDAGSPVLAEDVRRNLEISHREVRNLSRLVQDLFQLSKLDTHQLEFVYEAVSLVELCDQVGLAFEQRMADKEIEFVSSFPDDPLEVMGDGNRLAQVLTNLLGNASVFTPAGGRVTLTCERRGDQAVCSVADTGVGIAEKDLPHIFESFFHLEKSRTRNLGGTGLGLAICKAIVDAHEGVLEVTSRVGEGTTFSFRLALAPPVED